MVIARGMTIGRGAQAKAGAVATRAVEPYAVVFEARDWSAL